MKHIYFAIRDFVEDHDKVYDYVHDNNLLIVNIGRNILHMGENTLILTFSDEILATEFVLLFGDVIDIAMIKDGIVNKSIRFRSTSSKEAKHYARTIYYKYKGSLIDVRKDIYEFLSCNTKNQVDFLDGMGKIYDSVKAITIETKEDFDIILPYMKNNKNVKVTLVKKTIS
jgi:hypothetical protein